MTTRQHTAQRYEQGPTVGEAKPIPDEEFAHEVEILSPEGEPEHPVVKPSGIWLVLTIIALATLVSALVLGMIVNAAFGVALFGVGLLLLLTNPVLIASWLRSRERSKAMRQIRAKRARIVRSSPRFKR